MKNITHPKVIMDDGGSTVLVEGIDAELTAWRVTFEMPQEYFVAAVNDFMAHIGSGDMFVIQIEDSQEVSRRLETMDEHFSSPYYEGVNEWGFARND